MNRRLFAAILSLLLVLLLGVAVATAQGPSEKGTDVPDVATNSEEINGDISSQAAVGTAFTYQGRLTDNGNPANGIYDFVFSLYNAEIGGVQLADNIFLNNIEVNDGYFTAQVDFGSNVFNGDSLYLQIGIRPGNSDGTYTELTPRRTISPAPYAIYAERVSSLMAADGNPINALSVDNNGKIGVGTTAPQHKLHVLGDRIRLENGGKRVDLRADGSQVDIQTETSDLYLRSTGTGHDVIINPRVEDGNIGIGTQNPTAKLDVSGTVNIDGNVGIGTQNPAGKLDVNGTVKIKGKAPILIKRFENKGNNANFPVGVHANDYECVATGWTADFDVWDGEHGDFFVWTYTDNAGWWRARVQFFSEYWHENPDVDIVCFKKELVEYEGNRKSNSADTLSGGCCDD